MALTACHTRLPIGRVDVRFTVYSKEEQREHFQLKHPETQVNRVDAQNLPRQQ